MGKEIPDIAKKLATPPKGILAADESTKTCCARFESVHVECSEDKRREYRDIFITTPELGQYISGIILVDETVRQFTDAGISFLDTLKKQNVLAGIKVDGGLEKYDGEDSVEQVTGGLDGLDDKLAEYAGMGISFAKWRAAFSVGENLPTEGCIKENARRMAEYVRLCHKYDIVPIVEPEVLMEGDHTAEAAEIAIGKTLAMTVRELKNHEVNFSGIIIKTAMVVSGKNASNRAPANEVASRTVDILKTHIPEDIGGVVFLSGGQTSAEADENFDAIMKKADEVPFPMTFSFARAIQQPVLDAWANREPKDTLQELFINGVKNIAQR